MTNVEPVYYALIIDNEDIIGIIEISEDTGILKQRLTAALADEFGLCEYSDLPVEFKIITDLEQQKQRWAVSGDFQVNVAKGEVPSEDGGKTYIETFWMKRVFLYNDQPSQKLGNVDNNADKYLNHIRIRQALLSQTMKETPTTAEYQVQRLIIVGQLNLLQDIIDYMERS
jgi:hypothetical protein